MVVVEGGNSCCFVVVEEGISRVVVLVGVMNGEGIVVFVGGGVVVPFGTVVDCPSDTILVVVMCCVDGTPFSSFTFFIL